jgi:hypothetical protein
MSQSPSLNDGGPSPPRWAWEEKPFESEVHEEASLALITSFLGKARQSLPYVVLVPFSTQEDQY